MSQTGARRTTHLTLAAALSAALACASALVAVSCSDATSTTSPLATAAARKPSFAKGAPGGGGGTATPVPSPAPSPTTPTPAPAPAPSGGTQIPPSPQVDGPAWFFAEFGSVGSPLKADIDFDAMQNLSPGGIPVGTSRTATELVWNVSKKTALTITGIAFVGANRGDFSIAAADLAAAAITVLPPNKSASEALHVSFTPTGSGLRTATLQVTSAAGVAQIFLRGTGLPQRPVVAPIAPLTFFTFSAPANLTITNAGGQTLVLNSLAIGGANPAAFQFVVANHGLSNCFAGILLAPKSGCLFAVGLAPGATPPASATLVVSTNDPVNPTMNVPLTFTP